MLPTYHVVIASFPGGGTGAGAKVPPIALNSVVNFFNVLKPIRFKVFLKRPELDLRTRGPWHRGSDQSTTNRLNLAMLGLPRRPGPIGGFGEFPHGTVGC